MTFYNYFLVPKEIRNDPDFQSQVHVVTKALGMFGGSRDFGVWEKEYPPSSEDRREKMWLWFSIIMNI